ncbi:EF-hand domain-containing protein [Egbenema bharatensis]|uniref:EF-hand domain-containing protein n=1 Tax=Egbenema bharatensis TaxID=3463334 RepID=UPI003A8A1F00
MSENFGFEVPEEARQLLSPQKLEEIKQAFAQIDRNHDGKIELEEYMSYLLNREQENFLRKFKYLDTDQDGVIEFEEFLIAAEPHYLMLKKFKQFDTDGNGLLSFEEARHIAEKLEFPIDSEQLQKLMELIDRDNDGQVTFDEYLEAIIRFGFQ